MSIERVDYHVHTTFSDGEDNYKEVLNRAKALNLDCIAITDHFDKYDPNTKINSITEEKLIDHFYKIREYADKIGQNTICGIETCTDFHGNSRLNDVVIQECDIIITSPHYIEYSGDVIPGNYYDIKYWETYKKNVINMAKGDGNILGHSESYLPYDKMLIPNTTTFEDRQKLARDIADRYFDDSYIDELIEALKSSGKALEFHCITQSPREKVIKNLMTIVFQ